MIEDLKDTKYENYTYTLANLGLDLASLVEIIYYEDGNYTCPDYCSLEIPFED